MRDRVEELKGDLPEECIATGAWLSELAKERYKMERFPFESDDALRNRIYTLRFSEQLSTQFASALLDRRRRI